MRFPLRIPFGPVVALAVAAAVVGSEPAATSARNVPAPQREPPAPKELMERVGAWAENYLQTAPDYAATETREESVRGKKAMLESRGEVVSRYTLRRGGEGGAPIEAREFVSAGGERPGKNDDPAKLLPERVAGPWALVSRLATRNHERMRYFFPPDTSEVLSDEVLIGYRQSDGEGLIEIDDKRVAPLGRAWVNPDDGHVVRIEEEFRHKKERYSIAVDFARDGNLQTWVPSGITVRVFEKGRLEAQRVYTYAGFEPLRAARAETGSPPSKP